MHSIELIVGSVSMLHWWSFEGRRSKCLFCDEESILNNYSVSVNLWRKQRPWRTVLSINTDWERWNGLVEWPLSSKQFFPIRGQSFEWKILCSPALASRAIWTKWLVRKLTEFYPSSKEWLCSQWARQSLVKFFSLASSASWWSNFAKCSPRLSRLVFMNILSGINSFFFK